MVAEVRGHEHVAPCGDGRILIVAAGAAAHRHPAHRAASVGVPHSRCAQQQLDPAGVVRRAHAGLVAHPHPADAVGAARPVHSIGVELGDLLKTQRLGQTVVHPVLGSVQIGVAADGGDSSHVYMAGDSGGACLITYANAIQNSTNIARAANVTPSGLRINALGLISGMFYTSRFDKIGLFLPKYLYGRDYKKTPFAKYVNPENRELLNSLAPVWLVTSHNDFLRRYTTDFEKALTRAEREHELVVFPKNKKLTHAFSVFEPFMPESGAVIDMMVEYLRKF